MEAKSETPLGPSDKLKIYTHVFLIIFQFHYLIIILQTCARSVLTLPFLILFNM